MLDPVDYMNLVADRKSNAQTAAPLRLQNYGPLQNI